MVSGSISEIDQTSNTTDSGLSGILVASDVDVEILTYGIVDGTAATSTTTITKIGTYGTLSLNSSTGAYSYAKNIAKIEALDASETSSDAFIFSVTDGDGVLVTQSYKVDILGANDLPATRPLHFVMDEDSFISFDRLDIFFSDVDRSDKMSGIYLKSLPSKGRIYKDSKPIAIDSNPYFIPVKDFKSYIFRPAKDKTGLMYDKFDYLVSDDNGGISQISSISMDVTPVPDIIDPIATDDIIGALEKAIGVTLSGTSNSADFVYVSWGSSQKVAAVQNGVWSARFTSTIDVTIDTGDGNSLSITNIKLDDVYAAYPELIGKKISAYSIRKSEIPDDSTSSFVDVTAFNSDAVVIGSQSREIVIDTISPSSPSILNFSSDSVVNYLDSLSDITISGVSEPNSRIDLSWDRYSNFTSANENGVWSIAISPGFFTANGKYKFMFAKSTDLAGNTSTPSNYSYVIDIINPPVPTLSSVAQDNIININEASEGFSISGKAEWDSTVTLSFGNYVFTGVADVLKDWQILIPKKIVSSDSIDMQLVSVDMFGNVSPTLKFSPSIDFSVPEQSTVNLTDGYILVNSFIQANGLLLKGKVSPNSDVFLNFGYENVSTTASSSGEWSYTFASSKLYPDLHGKYLGIVTVEPSGNSSLPLYVPIKVDTDPPVISINPLISVDDVLSLSELANPLIVSGLSSADVSTIYVSFNNTILSASPVNGKWSVSFNPLSFPKLNGSLPIIVHGSDESGNITEVSKFITVALITPSQPTLQPISQDDILYSLLRGSTIPFTGSADPGLTVSLNFNSEIYQVTANSSGNWKANLQRPSTEGSFPISLVSFFHPTNQSVVTLHPFVFDITPPKPIHAKVYSNSIILTFEQKLSSSFIDSTSFKINYGIGNYLVNSSFVSDDLLSVLLDVSAELPSDLDVSISYISKYNSSSNLKDLHGNLIESFYSLVPSAYVASDPILSLASQYTQLLSTPSLPLLLTGNPLPNNIIGNNSDNIIIGKSGADILTGLSGADSFVYESLLDSVSGSSSSSFDHITDFDFSIDRLILPSSYKGSITSLPELSEFSPNSIANLAISSDLKPFSVSLTSYGQRSFLIINDGVSTFSPQNDGFIEITGYTGNPNAYLIA